MTRFERYRTGRRKARGGGKKNPIGACIVLVMEGEYFRALNTKLTVITFFHLRNEIFAGILRLLTKIRTMKLLSSVTALALIAGEALAVPNSYPKTGPVKGLLLPPSVKGPAPQYSIGNNPGPFAKVDGRLFVLDGKKQYFSGT